MTAARQAARRRCELACKSGDLAATYTIRHNYVLRAGIDNLFDVEPPTTGAVNAIPDVSVASSGLGTTNEGLYDALGRRFYVGINAKF